MDAKERNHTMNSKIEIIEDNGGGLTIQNAETKAVAYFGSKYDKAAVESLRAVLDNEEDMTGWDLSESEHYITDEEYQKHASSGGYNLWSEEDARIFVWKLKPNTLVIRLSDGVEAIVTNPDENGKVRVKFDDETEGLYSREELAAYDLE